MTTCPICSQQAILAYKSLLAYQQGQYYDIYFCSNCDASYADPLKIDGSLYDFIYSRAKVLPGYDRYFRFADDVIKVDNPLRYLAQTEDTYWAIYNFMNNYKIKNNPKILEVGCGLGYLTYALVKSGYNAKGVDISENAINEAKNKYGNYYEYADIYEYSKITKERFDIIVLTEVIEHIPDPVGFLSALKELLSPEGRILVTTPNKDEVISKEKYWDTELPPVHLWWFSKKSFQNIGSNLKLNVSFTDFTEFQSNIKKRRAYNNPWRQQTLTVDGSIIFKVPFNPIKHFVRRQLIDYNILRTWQLLKGKLQPSTIRESPSVSDRLCAILSNER